MAVGTIKKQIKYIDKSLTSSNIGIISVTDSDLPVPTSHIIQAYLPNSSGSRYLIPGRDRYWLLVGNSLNVVANETNTVRFYYYE